MDWIGLFLDVNGRIGRRAFWIGFLSAAAALLAADLLTGRAPAWVNFVVLAALSYPLAAVVIKRLHDVERSGWWTLILLSPLGATLVGATGARLAGAGVESILSAARMGFGLAVLVVLMMLAYLGARPGDTHYTRYGPPPAA